MSYRQRPVPSWFHSEGTEDDSTGSIAQPGDAYPQSQQQHLEGSSEHQKHRATDVLQQKDSPHNIPPLNSLRNPYSTSPIRLTPRPLFAPSTLNHGHVSFTPSPSPGTHHHQSSWSSSSSNTTRDASEGDAPAMAAFYKSECQRLNERIRQLESEQQPHPEQDSTQEESAQRIELLETALEKMWTAVHRACTKHNLPGCPEEENISTKSLLNAINSLADLSTPSPPPPWPPSNEPAAVEFHELLELFRYFAQLVYQYLLSVQDRLDPYRPEKMRVLDETNRTDWEGKEDAMLWAVIECVLSGRDRSLEVVKRSLGKLLQRVPEVAMERQAVIELRDMLLEASREDVDM